MDAIETVGNAGATAAPMVVHLVEKIEPIVELAPMVARNAEGAVQVGRTALNVAKGAALTAVAGATFGAGIVLFGGSAIAVIGGSFWLFSKASKGLQNRSIRKAKEAAEKAAVVAGAVPQPA